MPSSVTLLCPLLLLLLFLFAAPLSSGEPLVSGATKNAVNVKILEPSTGGTSLHALVHGLLDDAYELVDSGSPDFLFYTVRSGSIDEYKNCVKIFFSQEDVVPNFNKCDYGVSSCPMEVGDRHFRYVALGKADEFYKSVRDGWPAVPKSQALGRRFLKVANENANINLVSLLSNYKSPDYIPPKSFFESMLSKMKKKGGEDEEDERDARYKFTVVWEDFSAEGYTTGALMDAFRNRSVPIYFGNPSVGMDFNKKAFIHVNDYDSFEEVANEVIRLDNDDNAYLEMLNRSPLVNASYDPYEELRTFLVGVINKGNKPFTKNPLGLDHY